MRIEIVCAHGRANTNSTYIISIVKVSSVVFNYPTNTTYRVLFTEYQSSCQKSKYEAFLHLQSYNTLFQKQLSDPGGECLGFFQLRIFFWSDLYQTGWPLI